MSLIISTNEGGLSNRIKSWVSCYRLTPNKDKVKVYWPILDNYEKNCHILNCPFDNLFDNDIEVKKLSPTSKASNTQTIYKSHCLKILESDGLPANFNTFVSRCTKQFSYSDSQKRNIDFMYQEIPDNLKQEYRSLFALVKPSKHLQKKIDSFKKKFKSNTISVHIRTWNRNNEKGRRDYLYNLSKFETEMYKFPKKTTFYLSTDSSDTQDHFKTKFGKRVFIYPRKTDLDTSRDFAEGVQEDLIELFLLSQNNRMIGSHFSTFTEVAWWLGVEKKEISIL